MIHEVEMPKFPDQPVVIWAYERETGATEIASLEEKFAGLKIVPKNVAWQSTRDEVSDIEVNAMIWEDLAAESFGGGRAIIAGIFPPAAIEALTRADFSHCVGPDIWTPVSGHGIIYPARWAKLAGMA